MKLNQQLQIGGILALTVVFNFFLVSFFDYSFNPSYEYTNYPPQDFARDYGCQENCGNKIPKHTIDPAADGSSIWPVAKLAANLYSQGIIPLWNPYLAAGTPLAADSINFVFYVYFNFVRIIRNDFCLRLLR